MSDEDRLRAALQDGVPTPPAAPDRADGARRFARRRRGRRTTGAAVAAVVAVAALAIAPGVLGGAADRGVDRETGGAGPATPIGSVDLACPSEPVTTSTGPTAVTPGAVAVRLCQGPGHAIDEPDDALDNDIGELTTLVNDQELQQGNLCNQDLGPGYSLVFGYPHGGSETVVGELYGCRGVTVGGVQRDGGPEVLDRFVALLRQQREDREQLHSYSTFDLDCAERPESVVGELAEVTTAALCLEGRAPVLVAPRDLRTLVVDVVGGRPTNVPRCLEEEALELVGETTWGDRVSLYGTCNGWFADDGKYYPRSPASSAVIDRARRGAPPR